MKITDWLEQKEIEREMKKAEIWRATERERENKQIIKKTKKVGGGDSIKE